MKSPLEINLTQHQASRLAIIGGIIVLALVVFWFIPFPKSSIPPQRQETVFNPVSAPTISGRVLEVNGRSLVVAAILQPEVPEEPPAEQNENQPPQKTEFAFIRVFWDEKTEFLQLLPPASPRTDLTPLDASKNTLAQRIDASKISAGMDVLVYQRVAASLDEVFNDPSIRPPLPGLEDIFRDRMPRIKAGMIAVIPTNRD